MNRASTWQVCWDDRQGYRLKITMNQCAAILRDTCQASQPNCRNAGRLIGNCRLPFGPKVRWVISRVVSRDAYRGAAPGSWPQYHPAPKGWEELSGCESTEISGRRTSKHPKDERRLLPPLRGSDVFWPVPGVSSKNFGHPRLTTYRTFGPNNQSKAGELNCDRTSENILDSPLEEW